MPVSRHCLLIHNPIAGRRRGRYLARVVRAMEAEGCRVEAVATRARGHAEELSATARDGAFDVVVGAGGDGTLNEIACGLAGSAMPLAIVPLGTANVLAAEIGLPRAPALLARLVARGAPREIRLGLAAGRTAQRHFILMAGVGFDAHVVRGVNPALKRRIGKGAYAFEMLRQARHYEFSGFRALIDGVEHQAASLVASNGRLYGGPHLIAPAARLDEPMLHVCIFERGGTLDVIRYGLALVTGTLPGTAGFRVVPAREVIVLAPPGDPVQGDGDLLATLPITLSVANETLRLVMPEATAG